MGANGLGCSGQGFACVCAEHKMNTKWEFGGFGDLKKVSFPYMEIVHDMV